MEISDTTFSHFIQKAETLVTETLNTGSVDLHFEKLNENSLPLCEVFTQAQEEAFGQLSAAGTLSRETLISHYFTNFLWADQIKMFMLLWRDILFQQQKAQILLADDRVTEAATANLHEQSRAVLREAFESLSQTLPEQTRNLLDTPRKANRQLESWGHQQNPWPVYKKQIAKIPAQCTQLTQEYQALRSFGDIFRQIQVMTHESLSACEKEILDHKTLTNELIEQESSEKEVSMPKFVARLETLENEIVVKPYLNAFSERLEQLIAKLPVKQTVTVSIEGGILEVAEINIRRRTQLWLESQILPLLNEIWELTENTSNGLKMTIVNIRNRILILSAENREGRATDLDKSDFLLSLKTFLSNLEKREEQLPTLQQLIKERLENEFFISGIYKNPYSFLLVPLQSPVGRFSFTKNKVVTRIKNTISPYLAILSSFVKTVEKGDVLSPSEKIVRYIQSRKSDTDGSHYSSIFLTKGYVGESFIVGRDDELQHVRKVWENWQKGFRGAIVLTGKRLSGKTLFGELVGLRLFPEQVIALRPGQILNIQGRKMEVSFDLGKALAFIRKYTRQDHPMIWIDDLELWWSPEVPLYENVRMLTKYIDNHSSGHFVVVSMGNALYKHLCKVHDIQNIFQAEINMDYMSTAEIESAIWIRHGATHKNLVNIQGEEISNREFDRQINLVYRASRGIIGDSLSLWSHSTRKLDEINVANTFTQKHELPPLENPDLALLLASIMLQKRTNEYRLRKLFGPSFPERYQQLVRRLLSIGMLNRQMDDWLEIDESIVNDLGQLLEEGKYIQYNKI
ncbi:MAG: hypothetical protein R3D00_05490 [Bacteroidia bacterium]